jgi:hypothetical protein
LERFSNFISEFYYVYQVLGRELEAGSLKEKRGRERRRRLVAEVDTDFAVERTTGFLEREVVVKLGIGEVAALNREVVATVLN